MGFTCKRVRHKSGRNRDQDTVLHCCHGAQSIVDCSSNSRASNSRDRQKCDIKDRYSETTTTTTSTSTIYEQLALIHTAVDLVPTTHQDDGDDINTSLAAMENDGDDDDDDDNVGVDYMVECNKIEKSIPSNRHKSLRRLSVLNQLKRGFDSSVAALRIRMSAPTRTTKAKIAIVCHCEFEIMSKLLAIFAAPFWFAGTNTYSRFTHMINFKRKNSTTHHHRIFTLSPSHTELETIAPTKLHTTNNINNKNQNKIEYEYRSRSGGGSRSSSKYRIGSSDSGSDGGNKSNMIKTIYKSHNNRSIITSSQYFIRQSVCLYAASGFLIALCFMVIPAAASIDSLHPM